MCAMLYRFIDWSRRLARRLPAGLPSSCALCGIAGAAALCPPCHAQFFSHRPLRCTQCAYPLTQGEHGASLCGTCLRTPRAFDATIVASDYSAPIDHLVLALKFGNQLALAPLFAQLIADALVTGPQLRAAYHHGGRATRRATPGRARLQPCLLYTSPSPRDQRGSRMPSSA